MISDTPQRVPHIDPKLAAVEALETLLAFFDAYPDANLTVDGAVELFAYQPAIVSGALQALASAGFLVAGSDGWFCRNRDTVITRS